MKVSHLLSRAALCIAALGAVSALPAQAPNTSNRIALEQFLDFEDAQSPSLSPDGKQIIFTRRWVDKMNDRYATDMWLMNADGSHARALVQGSGVRWSPDGKRIAYIAKGEPSGSQIWVRWMDAEGATTQISHLTESPANLEWSPDGKTIAFTMGVADNSGQWRIPMPAPPKGAKWVEPPKIVTRLDYRSDHVGFDDESYTHIFVIPADGGTPRQITNGDWNHSAPNFSADGKWLAFSSNRVPDAQHAFRQSNVYAANIETGEIRQLTHHSGTDANPKYSPDGKYIADLSADSTYHAADDDPKLTLMNVDGSNRRVLTAGVDRTIGDLRWASDASGIYFSVSSEGTKNLYFVSVGGAVRPMTTERTCSRSPTSAPTTSPWACGPRHSSRTT